MDFAEKREQVFRSGGERGLAFDERRRERRGRLNERTDGFVAPRARRVIDGGRWLGLPAEKRGDESLEFAARRDGAARRVQIEG